MKNKYLWILIAVIVVAVLVVLKLAFRLMPYEFKPVTPSPPQVTTPASPPSHYDVIRVTKPQPNEIIVNPLVIAGEARGSWFFEASFPVRLLDANSNEIAVQPAQAQGEWMTENFVPFTAVLQFGVPATNTGTLVLERDNPSGMSANADELRIPVRFR